MATRKMDALFPKRKSSASGAKSGKVLSSASYKSRDPVYGAHDDIGSGGGSLGAADSQPAALISSGRQDLNEGKHATTDSYFFPFSYSGAAFTRTCGFRYSSMQYLLGVFFSLCVFVADERIDILRRPK
jgi:hypothetical protein